MGDLDYGERPSKTVARRIFVSAMQRLQAFASLSTYNYVGFGSIQFLDFDLVHRQLGISRMTSIESDAQIIDRCKFNRPFKGINVEPGTAGTVLPTLDWSRKAIVWLDYTQRLRIVELADSQSTALVLQPGSVLALTFNCTSGPDEDRRVEDLESAVGSERVPIGVTGARLGDWGLAAVQRQIATQTITRALADRGDGSTWQQLLNIHYRDGARMQMLVGIVDHPDIHVKLQGCRFGDMPEIRMDAEALEMMVPMLTPRERQAINARLPGSVGTVAGIPEAKIRAYANMYRWLDAPA